MTATENSRRALTVAVLGASGRTGREVVRQALDQGHQVIAIVRDPSKMPPMTEAVTVATADVHDRPSTEAALKGTDAVVSALGGRPRQPTTVYSHGIEVIDQAMHAVGIRRLICLSTGALDLGPHVPLGQRIVSRAVVRLVFKHGHADMAKMESNLRSSDLDWTVVRVPGLTTKPAQGAYRVDEAPLDRPSTVPRADLANYLVSILQDTTTHRKVLEISS